ncbi:general transcription repressor [Botryosphaeria dothidea]
MATTSAPASPQARLTIKEAFERLKQSVTPDDARRFQATTLQDVHDAAIVVEDKIAASGSLRNLRRIEPFLTGLGRYAKVIEVMCNGTDYLPWIWLASDYSSSLQKLLDSYAQICDTLPRFDRLSVAFKNNVHFQKVLAMFYADILEFHRQAYKFFTQRGTAVWRRLFDTSWTGFDRRFKGILDNLSRNAELVEKEATAADITEAKEWRDNQKLNIALFEKERLSSQALTPSICNLRKLLSDLIPSLQSPIIVLDGIDESPLEEQRTIIREIMSLFKGSSQNSGLKALFSSRDVPTLSKSLSKTASICLSDEHLSVNLAIEIFVDRKLNELRDNLDEVQFDESLASSMKRKIVERANGNDHGFI